MKRRFSIERKRQETFFQGNAIANFQIKKKNDVVILLKPVKHERLALKTYRNPL